MQLININPTDREEEEEDRIDEILYWFSKASSLLQMHIWNENYTERINIKL
jgi:hypothetical protein